jgi:hypothetical protein
MLCQVGYMHVRVHVRVRVSQWSLHCYYRCYLRTMLEHVLKLSWLIVFAQLHLSDICTIWQD